MVRIGPIGRIDIGLVGIGQDREGSAAAAGVDNKAPPLGGRPTVPRAVFIDDYGF
jgi:hypothetical protein